LRQAERFGVRASVRGEGGVDRKNFQNRAFDEFSFV
jgi:hypothetical protein